MISEDSEMRRRTIYPKQTTHRESGRFWRYEWVPYEYTYSVWAPYFYLRKWAPYAYENIGQNAHKEKWDGARTLRDIG